MQGCGVCKYFSAKRATYLNHGHCRYNPPVVVPHHDDAPEYLQPVVSQEDWCGKFEPRQGQRPVAVPKRAHGG